MSRCKQIFNNIAICSLKYDFDLLPQDVSINVPHVLYQLLYMICKTRVYICACIDACVCMCVCICVCICLLKCLRAECRRLYVGISLSHRNEARFVIFGWHVLQGLQIFLPWERCFRNQAFAFLSGCPSGRDWEPPQKCRSQKVGIIKCKSRADRSKPVGLLVRPPAACSAMAARRFGPV